MAWTLLIMLALYDLFAVLSPCGPLKALVNLMSKDDAPSMPGLLYEARLPENATRPGRQRRRNDGGARNQSGTEEQNVPSRDNGDTNASADDDNGGAVLMLRGGGSGGGDDVMSNGGDVCSGNNAVIDAVDALETRQKLTSIPRRKRSSRQNEGASSQSVNNAPSENDASMPATEAPRGSSPPTVIVPLAIAKVYKLPLVPSSSLATIASLDASSPIAYLQQEHPFTAADLQTNVEVGLPRNGGRIETTHNGRGKPRYVIYNREGQLKRTLLVDETGLVMEVVPNDEDGKTDTSDNNIKLGLGDFIFYSVLVSKAADHGFAAFVACFLSVLAGLGGTLVLLAIFHHALPALPISIFLAVIMFILTISCMEPWIEGVWSGPYYV
jgi:presenilin 1